MIKPLHDYVLIEPGKPIEKIGGIIISRGTGTAEEGKVKEVGPQVEGLKRGDTILYKDYNLISVKIQRKGGEVELCFIKADDIICVSA